MNRKSQKNAGTLWYASVMASGEDFCRNRGGRILFQTEFAPQESSKRFRYPTLQCGIS